MTTQKVTKADLLKPSPSTKVTEDVEIKGIGTVTIKSVTRAAAVRAQNYIDFYQDSNQAEVIMLASALVEPKLTEEEVTQFRENCTNSDLRDLMGRVISISGLSGESDPKEDSTQ